ncbi:peptidylprolyl isomerase [Xylanibacter ruminicola]|uniref:Peptidyl-prolyl cis-trans isomerase SurA n=1 Tax=Xylanibacter ruminicola TaxID=839 RepID=A0A1M6UI68_XYLRU|nr:peptidylprolyl isomerase [Xylanibacter ruminicola]SHK68945.1 peptidyl-prolyl cis-trans isomerase SurA [Xylanibacter ruminicola]
MRKLTIALSLFAAIFSQQTLAQSSDPTVMTINGVPVSRSEFEYSYNKNNGEGVIDKLTVDEYVNLFVNYKLKVAAALDAKLDTLSSFRREYAMYRDQQIKPTLVTDADVLSEAQQMYDRTKTMIGNRGLIHPAHILIKLSTKANIQQQEYAKQRIDSVYRVLQGGADFAEVAKKVSEDYGSAMRGGELPWIAPSQTLKEFEDVAYSLAPGEMSKPFLSPVGYHIVLMKERKQLEPFDSLKQTIVASLERRGIRNNIADIKLRRKVTESAGKLTIEEVMQQKADSLAATNSDLKYLFLEYHDGLLLYEISSREVWNKASHDETALKAWFDTHKKSYAYSEPRYKGIAYHVKTKGDVKAVKKSVKNLPFDQWAEVLRTTFNADSVIRIRVEQGIFKPGDNKTIDKMVFKTSTASDDSLADYPIDAVYGKKVKRPDDYNDVRQQVVDDLQDYLEKEWVTDLRRRYQVEVNKEVLKTVNKHL